MWSKIKKAAFEGVLITKGIRFVFTKLPKIIVEKLDWCVGCLARALFAYKRRINKNQIMMIPFQGDYTCNLKYIMEEINRRELPYEVVFSARHKSYVTREGFPDNVRVIEQFSSEFYQEIAKSKMIIANSVEFLKKPTPKKRGQILIETWHGSLGIKRFGAKENSGKEWVAAAVRCGKRADYILSNSDFEDGVYRDTFWKKTKILQYGHPRNDILFLEDEQKKQEILDKLLAKHPKAAGLRLALYAPTFRDSHATDCYNIKFDKLTKALSERFGGEWGILVKLHPTVRTMAKQYAKGKKNIIDVTAYPDIQELMLVSDVAITDYSSWIYDFVLTGRPGFIYATDVNSYVTERGFYYPLTATPFPVASKNDALIENILSFNEEEYKEKVEEFLSGKGCIDDGHAAERTVDKIVELMG